MVPSGVKLRSEIIQTNSMIFKVSSNQRILWFYELLHCFLAGRLLQQQMCATASTGAPLAVTSYLVGGFGQRSPVCFSSPLSWAGYPGTQLAAPWTDKIGTWAWGGWSAHFISAVICMDLLTIQGNLWGLQDSFHSSGTFIKFINSKEWCVSMWRNSSLDG